MVDLHLIQTMDHPMVWDPLMACGDLLLMEWDRHMGWAPLTWVLLECTHLVCPHHQAWEALECLLDLLLTSLYLPLASSLPTQVFLHLTHQVETTRMNPVRYG